jgi:uncharacterized protein YkwD
VANTQISRRRLLALAGPAALLAGLAVPASVGAAPLPANFALLERVNAERAARGLGRLAWNGNLNTAAQNYSRVVRANGSLSHYLNGTDLGSRANAAGYRPWSYLGENIAGGYWSPDQVVQAWIASPAHNKVMFDPGYNEAGIGIDYGGQYGVYWVLDLGRR